MRFVKPLTVGVAGAVLLAVPFAGVSLAATAEPAPEPAVTVVGDDHRAPVHQVSVKAEVTPGEVAAGDAYKVTIFAKGVRPGATATVRSPQGVTYKVALNDGRATKTLTVPRATKPGRYKLGVTVAGRVTTAEFTVTRDERDGHDSRGRTSGERRMSGSVDLIVTAATRPRHLSS
ncbi:hypothetical protein HTZ77_18325 [Nonomuraea sp. SMC257]|uniref:Ig-like domain repeat protein n=1 Tax=Nonomuraea montanisoli TaxID=2741721 RepID=A0A7Y6I9L2_9ACTN|nr:hypothetical protein [Nonomuraea montanisoli]NUW33370.1 hypothetical protein [Nonomuraea montanisoli]